MAVDLKAAALAYAQRGWAIFPLWWIEGGHCACSDGGRCESPGKHPISDLTLGLRRGFYDATRDTATIERWWTYYPRANIGGATGAPSNIDVLDVDYEADPTSKRPDGIEAFRQLQDQYRPLSDQTPCVRTAGGGRHYFFVHADGIGCKRGHLPRGIDVRGNGGYVVLPPSLGLRGPYGWITAPVNGYGEWPDWLVALIREEDDPGPELPDEEDEQEAELRPERMPDQLSKGERNVWLTSLAGTLRRRGSTEAEIVATLETYNRERCDPPLPHSELRKIARSMLNYQPGPTNEQPWTDLGLGRRLALQFGEGLRYCVTWGRWLHWNGKRWSWDLTGEVMRRAKHSAEMIVAEANAIEDKDKRAAQRKYGQRSQSLGKLRAAIELAASEEGMWVHHDELDTNPWLLNCRNGTIDLKTGRLLIHEPTNYITRMIDLDYDPDAQAPLWQAVLHAAMLGQQELIDYLQRAFGYSLTGIVSEDKFFIWWGSGANAKSTIQEAVLDVLGPYAGVTDPEFLMDRRGESHPTGLADLFGRRLVFAQETSQGRALNETLVKQLTGGDRIKARRMREDFWEFEPTHKFVLITNHKPTVRDNGPAFWRRVVIVPFRRVFDEAEQDRDLPAKLVAEGPGILAWLVQGCLAWQQEGLGEPHQVKDAIEEYRMEQDILGAWIANRCEEATDYEEETMVLHTDYRDWLSAGGWKVTPTIQTFGMMLNERGYGRRKTNGKNLRTGIRLRRRANDERPRSLYGEQPGLFTQESGT